jgi:hypothetical protein
MPRKYSTCVHDRLRFEILNCNAEVIQSMLLVFEQRQKVLAQSQEAVRLFLVENRYAEMLLVEISRPPASAAEIGGARRSDKRLATPGGSPSTRALGQMCERGLQASRKFRVRASNFAKQPIRYDPESPHKFGDVELSDQRAFELRCHAARQLIYATAVGSRKAVPNAS